LYKSRQGLSGLRATGAELARMYALALLAEAYGTREQVKEGLAVLAEALAIADETEERYYEVELYRLKGTFTFQQENQKPKVKSQKLPIPNL